MTIKEFAEKTGISERTILGYFSEKRQPQFEVLVAIAKAAIAKAVPVDLNWLVLGETKSEYQKGKKRKNMKKKWMELYP